MASTVIAGDGMRRRNLIGVICGAALAPFGAAAQQSGKVWRIGYVSATTPEQGEPYARALEQRLADRGDVEGGNITLLKRFAGPQMDKIEEAVISLPTPAVGGKAPTRTEASHSGRIAVRTD